jgi:hypothetical protein
MIHNSFHKFCIFSTVPVGGLIEISLQKEDSLDFPTFRVCVHHHHHRHRHHHRLPDIFARVHGTWSLPLPFILQARNAP